MICECGHSPLAHHGERSGDTSLECLYVGCGCVEYRSDPYAFVTIPIKWARRWSKEYRHGYKSGHMSDGMWNPVSKIKPLGRAAWVAGKEAGRRARERGEGIPTPKAVA
jgi:hypothetical protein